MEKGGVERKVGRNGPHKREMEKRHEGIGEAKTAQSVGCKNMMHGGGGAVVCLFSVCACTCRPKGHTSTELMKKHTEKEVM